MAREWILNSAINRFQLNFIRNVGATSEEDCIKYMHQMVIDRTFDGYMTEIKTIYGQLQKEIGKAIERQKLTWEFWEKLDN